MQPAYVLHARDYRDTSLLVELFTPAQGRIAAVARGARSQRRGISQRAVLQPFQPLWIECAGPGELKSLRQVEVREPALPLRGPALFSGFYVNEVLCRLLHRDDEHSDLFRDYETVLQQLAREDMIDVALRHFELRLLDALGYGFTLSEAAHSGEPIVAERNYRFDAAAGLVNIGHYSIGHTASVEQTTSNGQTVFCGADILDFLAGNYSASARRAMKVLCRMALQPHLGSKPLRSRKLFIS